VISNEFIQLRQRLDTAIRRISKLEAQVAVFDSDPASQIDVVTKIIGGKKTNGKKKA
jgi:hypothetical protein